MKKILLAFLLSPIFINAQVVTTIAGNGIAGFSGDGAAAIDAQLFLPSATAVDGSGNVYIADSYNNRIRMVTAAGIISTVAGTGDSCGSEPILDGVPATSVPIESPGFVALDDTGNLYIKCFYTIRKVNHATGIISTLAHCYANGIAVDGSGNVYMDQAGAIIKRDGITGILTTIAGNPTTYGFGGDGGPATNALLSSNGGIAVDLVGNIYIADGSNQRIRKITLATGIINTIAGSGSIGYSGDGFLAITAEFNQPSGIAIDNAGNIYLADDDNNVIRKIDAGTGIINTIAGTGVPGYRDGLSVTSQVNIPTGVAVDGGGNVYVADFENNRIRKISPTTTSVNAIENQSTSKIYPNPATKEITISSTNQINQVKISNIIAMSLT